MPDNEIIRFACPQCQKRLRVNADFVGKQIPCPNKDCGQLITIPPQVESLPQYEQPVNASRRVRRSTLCLAVAIVGIALVAIVCYVALQPVRFKVFRSGLGYEVNYVLTELPKMEKDDQLVLVVLVADSEGNVNQPPTPELLRQHGVARERPSGSWFAVAGGTGHYLNLYEPISTRNDYKVQTAMCYEIMIDNVEVAQAKGYIQFPLLEVDKIATRVKNPAKSKVNVFATLALYSGDDAETRIAFQSKVARQSNELSLKPATRVIDNLR